ncbi:MAG TPA: HEAT repeat domain-containing protein, partial [Anaeromyxobacteraceae bacterium]|nr:HEAT repeat domain-containing protein [Anaeromyxobacteraceae bacterium]
MRPSGPAGLRSAAEALLRAEDFEVRLAAWDRLPARRAVRPLLSFLSSPEEILRWRAVRALGVVVARLADEDLEAGRVTMRKLMWSLAEESGGFGWGVPEAMGEIMARHQGLAREFGHVLLAYVREDGSRLDSDLLLRGALWGLGRVARVRPDLLPDAASHLEPFLRSGDAAQRGLASWALA